MSKNSRYAKIERNTSETFVRAELSLDGTGSGNINTTIPFVDHMLNLLAKHGLFDLTVEAKGDTEIDHHHTVEDIGIVLGMAVDKALGEKLGIRRYGFALLPMDESLAQIALDFGGRSMLVYDVELKEHFVRDFSIGLVREFFRAFANMARANVHITLLYGREPHHVVEAIFKGFAQSLDMATSIDGRRKGHLPSTKGVLD
jgi:imidazoleglycerol-phosphate dehydratase